MKTLLILTCLLISGTSFGQFLDGDLLAEGRKSTKELPFIIEGTKNGWATYELSVDREGKVTSARLVETDLKSTPSKMHIRDYVMGYTFEPGTYYPKFHHVTVKITLLKPLDIEQESIPEK